MDWAATACIQYMTEKKLSERGILRERLLRLYMTYAELVHSFTDATESNGLDWNRWLVLS